MSDIRGQIEREFHQTWRQRRLIGRRRYALVYGVGVWGGLTLLGLVGGAIVLGRFDITVAALQTAVIVPGGYFVGIKMWDHNERRFALNCANPEPDSLDST